MTSDAALFDVALTDRSSRARELGRGGQATMYPRHRHNVALRATHPQRIAARVLQLTQRTP